MIQWDDVWLGVAWKHTSRAAGSLRDICAIPALLSFLCVMACGVVTKVALGVSSKTQNESTADQRGNHECHSSVDGLPRKRCQCQEEDVDEAVRNNVVSMKKGERMRDDAYLATEIAPK